MSASTWIYYAYETHFENRYKLLDDTPLIVVKLKLPEVFHGFIGCDAINGGTVLERKGHHVEGAVPSCDYIVWD